ncbi:MAG: hypothetical protein V4561_02685 [Bacteroidota bacterium]
MRLNISKLISLLVLSLILLLPNQSRAEAKIPDTVRVGIYITSIHNIDFKEKEYTTNFWLWLKYKNKDFNFVDNLEIPQAKTVVKSFTTIDSSDGEIYILMKLQCIMKDTWKITNFPFDHQTLRLSIENSQFDKDALVFSADTAGKQFDPRFALRGWKIDSLRMSTGTKVYETAFGDDSILEPHTEYSNFKVKIIVSRAALGLFWKMFLGMYVAFFIAFMCFFIHTDSIDSRFGLSVGALFGVIGNKYIIDAALPESSSFTLVDTLHGITLIFILGVIMASAYSLKLITNGNVVKARLFDRKTAFIFLLAYLMANIVFIYSAYKGW